MACCISKPTTIFTGRILRNMAILCLVFSAMVYFALYNRSFNWRRIYTFLPKSLTVKQETLVCQDLIKAAKRILDSEPIPIPFSGRNKTWWKFKQSAPKEFIKNHFLQKSSSRKCELFMSSVLGLAHLHFSFLR